MAAQLVTTIKRYIGTAAEIAAMTLTGIPTGSTFFESDTGILKVLNAAGALVTAPSETVQLSGSNIAVPVDLQFHDIGDLTPLPVKELNASNFVTVVNASIIDNAFHYYNSAVAITPAQMREYRSFKIHIFDTHDQACTNFKIYHNNIAQAFEPVTGMIIYSNGTLLAGTGSKVALLMGKAAGAGADPTLITLPFLEDTVLSGLSFEIKYGTAPTTGTLKIVLEMNR